MGLGRRPLVKAVTAALAALLPKTRFGIDNMTLSMATPSEEEFALDHARLGVIEDGPYGNLSR